MLLQENNRITGRNGFTLVEIMIVVGIIGLLAAIAIPNFLRARNRSQQVKCVNNLRVIDGAVAQWALENRQSDTAQPTPALIQPYLKNGVIPTCPAGGNYDVPNVATPATCTISGHSASSL